MFATIVFTKKDSDIDTHFEAKDDQGPTIKDSTTVRMARQKFLRLLPVTAFMLTNNRRAFYTLTLTLILTLDGDWLEQALLKLILITHSLFLSVTPWKGINISTNIKY